MKNLIRLSLILISLQSCYKEEKQFVLADFSVSVDYDKYTAPVRIIIDNKTTGASEYQWTFEGGEPSSSTKHSPDAVVYYKPGKYIIHLEAWNDDERKSKEFVLMVDSIVNINFDLAILINNISPVQTIVTNRSKGGKTYKWDFGDGSPSKFDVYTPSTVTFSQPGEHTISLEIFNGSETFTLSKTITVLPAMALDFSITPSFEDEDMEAPLIAILKNNSNNGLKYTWTSPTGVIANDSASTTTTIYFANEGTHTITLEANNGKEIKSLSKSIHVKPNTNLYIMNDVKLGIKSAHASIGSFYSCALRKAFAKDEVNETNGHLIDFAFLGINETFSYCRILSPDSVFKYAFYQIPKAKHSAIINTQESSLIEFAIKTFDVMTSDAQLKSLGIKRNDTHDAYFTNSVSPRIVLFETADGRKGAIKIKQFVSNGQQSYILADIKVQKEKN